MIGIVIVLCATAVVLAGAIVEHKKVKARQSYAVRTLAGINEIVNESRKIDPEARIRAVQAMCDQYFERKKPEAFGHLTEQEMGG